MGIAVAGSSPITIRPIKECSRVGPGPHRPPTPGVVLERLTSGTTGPPKRIPVTEDVLIPALKAGEQSSSVEGEELRRIMRDALQPVSWDAPLWAVGISTSPMSLWSPYAFTRSCSDSATFFSNPE